MTPSFLCFPLCRSSVGFFTILFSISFNSWVCSTYWTPVLPSLTEKLFALACPELTRHILKFISFLDIFLPNHHEYPEEKDKYPCYVQKWHKKINGRLFCSWAIIFEGVLGQSLIPPPPLLPPITPYYNSSKRRVPLCFGDFTSSFSQD